MKSKPPAPEQGLTYQDLLQIVDLIQSSSQFSEFRLRSGGMEIDLRRANGAPARAIAPTAGFTLRMSPLTTPDSDERHGPAGGELVAEPAVNALRMSHAHAMPAGLAEGAIVVRSPMVGTYYAAPEPGARPFVECGQRVQPDTIVCIIEVMKLMNSIPAGCAGVVTHVLIENAEPVEFGEPLVVIDPSA